MHNIYADHIKKKEYTNMSQLLKIYTLFHEQAVCRRSRKMEKDLLGEMKIAT